MNAMPPLPSSAGQTSLAARLLNIFAAPGEVFDEIRTAPVQHANWALPVGLACVAAIVAVLVLFSQPTILQQVRDQQHRAIEKKMAGVPAEQRAETMALVEKVTSPPVLKIFGSMGAAAGTCGYVLVSALALWLIARLRYKVEFAFIKAVEAAGLAWIISLVNVVLATLLKVGKGNLLATPGPVLFLPQIDSSLTSHRLLAACDLLGFWLVAVLALALARLAGIPFWRALPWLLAPVILFKLLAVLAGMGGL